MNVHSVSSQCNKSTLIRALDCNDNKLDFIVLAFGHRNMSSVMAEEKK